VAPRVPPGSKTFPAEYSRPPRRSAGCDAGIHIVQFWAAYPQRSSLRGDAIRQAAAGVLPPVLAAADMAASSVTVVGNALRLRRFGKTGAGRRPTAAA
jgi:hypothetical protein